MLYLTEIQQRQEEDSLTKNDILALHGKASPQSSVEMDVLRTRLLHRSKGLDVDTEAVVSKALHGAYPGISTTELDELLIRTAASLIAQEPDYTFLASRLLSDKMSCDVRQQSINAFSQSVAAGYRLGVIAQETHVFVSRHAAKLDAVIDNALSDRVTFFGMRTLCDRYVLRHPTERKPLETIQYLFLRVACGIAKTLQEAQELYSLFASLDYLPSSPTLFNAGTTVPQMSSCFLLDSPQDSLESIYNRYKDAAMLSKYAGGIGIAYHRVRSSGAVIKGTNGMSNGIVPWLKTLDSSVAAVNQGGRRKGACCVYLEPWHADIEAFLELRDNTGDEARRTHNLNLANWIPNLFMQRVEEDASWSLFDPATVPQLVDLYGEKFEQAYVQAEQQGLAMRSVRARDLYGRMMRTLAQTGNGWMTFKDASNLKSNQTGTDDQTIHLSNLCTEILEVTSDSETAVCNLGSVNLARHVTEGQFDFTKLAKTVRLAVRQLNRVIDLTYYPIRQAASSNARWRPVGLGVMGLQDVLFQLGLHFDSSQAKQLTGRIAEEIYYHALTSSADLAEIEGAHEAFAQTKAAKGVLQFDLWNVKPTDSERWNTLKQRIQKVGLRNSLLIAIAPTASIGSIAGCYECIEPQVSNLFKRETLSGEFLQINIYLVRELKKLGLWTQAVRDQIVVHEGSIQTISVIPQHLRDLFKTAWELPMKALIDMAAARGPYIDQSQSLNLFMETPELGKVSSMYFYAWKKGLKTTYYLRSRPATSISKTTVTQTKRQPSNTACSLENPETCEACQ